MFLLVCSAVRERFYQNAIKMPPNSVIFMHIREHRYFLPSAALRAAAGDITNPALSCIAESAEVTGV